MEERAVTDDWQRLKLTLEDEASIVAASDAMHDALFREKDIEHLEQQGVFRLTAWREVAELARRDRMFLLLTRVRMPRVRTVLELHSVTHASVEKTDRYGLDEYCLEGISHDASQKLIRIQIMGPLKIELHIERVSGMLRDIGKPTWDAPDIVTVELFQRSSQGEEK